MRFLVLKSITAAIVITTAALSTHPAKAETTLKVPFDFTVAGQRMPAGLYTVKEDVFHNLVTLRSQDGLKSFSYTLTPGDPDPTDSHIALKFEAAGSSHVLRRIQYGPRVTTLLDAAPAPGYDPGRLSMGR